MTEPKQNMNQPMKEEPGNTKALSHGNRKAAFLGEIVCYVGTRPVNLLCYALTWFHLYSLCQFGRLHKNIPVLLLCLLWWIGVTGYVLRLWFGYGKAAMDEADSPETDIGKAVSPEKIRWYSDRKGYCRIFLKEQSVIEINLQKLESKENDFLDLKLSAVSVLGKQKYRLAAGLLVALVTICGSALVVKSAIPYHGKLSWYLDDLRDKRSVTLQHDNIYESGVEGILEDINHKVNLPETLCLATSFNLHFASDGTILTFDTMLYGFDENGNFTDSYLITYNAAHSEKIDIYLHGAGGAVWNADKDLQPFIEAVSVMPLEETVAEWQDETSFGILYYGTREWHGTEGIRFLNYKGESRTPSEEEYYFSGYSASVFCPDNEERTPVRYLCMGYQDFPEEEAKYTADYYPKETEAAPQIPHATDNYWRHCEDYPTEQYGEIREKEQSYTDVNGEVIYRYTYQNLHMNEDISNAQMVNAFLEAKEAETIEEWQTYGEQLAEKHKVAEYYYWGNHPTDSQTFTCITYYEWSYCSLIFFGKHYTGDVSALPYLSAYTINKDTGKEVTLQEIASHITEEEWIELINRAFEKEQGFRTLLAGTESAQTAGEYWYDSYLHEKWGSGFYLTKEGIAFYFGFGHIAWEGEGLIEMMVTWKDINAQ